MEEKNKISVQNSRFGRSLEGYFQEVFPWYYSQLLKQNELYNILAIFTELFSQKYIKYLGPNNDVQFAFNEAYEEVVCLINADYDVDDEKQYSIFDLDKNTFIDSDQLN